MSHTTCCELYKEAWEYAKANYNYDVYREISRDSFIAGILWERAQHEKRTTKTTKGNPVSKGKGTVGT